MDTRILARTVFTISGKLAASYRDLPKGANVLLEIQETGTLKITRKMTGEVYYTSTLQNAFSREDAEKKAMYYHFYTKNSRIDLIEKADAMIMEFHREMVQAYTLDECICA